MFIYRDLRMNFMCMWRLWLCVSMSIMISGFPRAMRVTLYAYARRFESGERGPWRGGGGGGEIQQWWTRSSQQHPNQLLPGAAAESSNSGPRCLSCCISSLECLLHFKCNLFSNSSVRPAPPFRAPGPLPWLSLSPNSITQSTFVLLRVYLGTTL